MKIPSRTDNQYTDIEEFKEYELTYCIAYEMAIRNNKVQKLIKSYIKDELKKYFIDLHSLYSEYHLKRQNNYNELRKFFINPHSLYLKYHFFTQEEQKKETFIKKIHQYEKKEFKNNEEMVTTFTKETKEYTVYSSESIKTIQDGSITSYNTWIKPSYSRPQIFSVEQEKTVKAELNLAMPKNELIDFIKIIKESFDKDNNSIKSISELLGNEPLFLKDKIKYPKKPKAEKFADWFFIYDLYNIKKIKSRKSDLEIFGEIDLELLEYYNSSRDDYYSSDTYRLSIMPIMRSFIDKLKYKQILTEKI